MNKQILVQIFLFILMGCSIFGPESILNELTCEPPCWQNIIPGETRKGEVLNLLGEVDNIVLESVFQHKPGWNEYHKVISFEIDNNGEMVHVSIYFIDNIVSYLTLYNNLGVDLNEAIQVFGEPNLVFANPSHTFRTYLINEEVGIYYIAEKRSYIFSNEEIDPETEVILISFFDPSVFPTWIENGDFTNGWLQGEELMVRMYPWMGYGNVTELYMS